MTMFSTDWQCRYDELITYYPRYYREVFEMDAILRAEGELADDIQTGIDKMLANNFVLSADESAVAQLETMLNISSSGTLEERRQLIISHIMGFGKISATALKAILSAYLAEKLISTSITFDPVYDDNGNTLYSCLNISIELADGLNPDDYSATITSLITERLPAHIAYSITYICNTYGELENAGITYEELSGATYSALRYVSIEDLSTS